MEIPVDLPLVKVKVLQCSSERRCAGHNRMKDASDCFDGNLVSTTLLTLTGMVTVMKTSGLMHSCEVF